MVYGPRASYGSGIPIDAKLSTVIKDFQWKWPPARTEAQLEIHTLICGTIIPRDSEDKACCLGGNGIFHTGNTWNWLRNHDLKVIGLILYGLRISYLRRDLFVS